jgi:hypothetical protein
MVALNLFGRSRSMSLEAVELGSTGPPFVPHDQLRALLAGHQDVFPQDIPKGVPPETVGLSVFPLERATSNKRNGSGGSTRREGRAGYCEVAYMEDMGLGPGVRSLVVPVQNRLSSAAKGELPAAMWMCPWPLSQSMVD